MNKPPDAIWLQFHGDAEPDDDDEPIDSGDVTWCADKIFEHDIRYVTLDCVRRTIANMRLVASTWNDVIHERKRETLEGFALELERMAGVDESL